MNNRLIVRTCLAAAAALLFMGCSSGTPAGPKLNPTTGSHPATWLNDHWSAYLQNPASCVTCHGSTTTPSATPNNVAPSCFTCHPNPNNPNHPANWATGTTPAHGLAAMGFPGANFNPAAVTFPMSGFNSCTPCHAQNDANGNPDFTNPLGITPSCLTSGCHASAAPFAPHSLVSSTVNSYLWGAGAGTGSNMPNHDQVDPSNAPTCALCHTYSATTPNPNNAGLVPVVPAPASAAPGCANGTLCHSARF